MTKDNSPTLAKIDKFRRDELKQLLAQCTPGQHHVFRLMYSHKDLEKPIEKVVDDMPPERIDWAICQVETTIINNTNRL